METRGATGGAAQVFQNLFGGSGASLDRLAGNIGGAFGRNAAGSAAQFMGFSPDTLSSMGPRIESILASPGEQTFDLFSAMEPFEQRETRRQVGDLREAFGTAGARFSPNLLGAETELRGELANQFQRGRAEQLLAARDRQLQGMDIFGSQLLGHRQAGLQESLGPLQAILQFLQPGAPTVQQGIVPGLLGAAATLGGAHIMRPHRPSS